ncbi:MAG: hypothetical protein WC080_04390 [Patescibacteria group bacterium]
MYLILTIAIIALATVFLSFSKTRANPGTCYWVGDTSPANWNDPSHWSNSSGGAGNTCEGGVNIPQSGTAVVFNSANNNSVNVDTDVNIASISIATGGYSGTFDATTHNIYTSGNITFSSGTLHMGSGTWTIAGGVTLTNISTFDAGSSTLIMTGTTKNLIGAAQTLHDLSISGTVNVATSNVSVGGILSVEDGKTLTINSNKFLIMNSGAVTNLNNTGTITGSSGYLALNDSAGENLSAGGTLSSKVRFDATSGDVKVRARTYGAQAEFYSNSALSARTITLGTSASQTLDFSSNFYVLAANTQNIAVSAAIYNPSINITGNIDFTGTGAGSESLSMGSSVWTLSGNIDMQDGSVIGGTSTLVFAGSAAAQIFTPNAQTFHNIIVKNTNAAGTILNGNGTQGYKSGNLVVSGNLYLSADGASDVLLDGNTHHCGVTVEGSLDFVGEGDGQESILLGNNTWIVDGNVDFTGGTINAGNSTLELAGIDEQNLTLAGQTLNDLRVSNESGNSINFIGDVTAVSFAIACPDTKVVLDAGGTYSFTNINIDGRSLETPVKLVSSLSGSSWNFDVSGIPLVSHVEVSDSNASGGNKISAINSIDSGHNSNWEFLEDAVGFSPDQNTWRFSSPQDYVISDASKIQFSNSSAKIIPTGFETAWGKVWHDTHFAPNPGESGAESIIADSSGNFYVSGYTRNGAGGSDTGFIVKLDQDLNEIWYKNDYFTDSLKSEVYRMAIASDGNILAHGGYQDSSGNCHSVLMKLSPSDGSVVWSSTIDQPAGVVRLSGWDRAGGPVIDKEGNIYIAVANHLGDTQNDAEPSGIYKFDSNGNLIWSRSDSLASRKTGWNWEDMWGMAIDSEGSVYISYSCGGPWPSSLYWGLLKYDTDGNYQWMNIKLWSGENEFQAARGISIDPATDIIYQNGNAGGSSSSGCGFRKIDKYGNVLFEEIMHDIAFGGDTYCWGSIIDQFGNWNAAGQDGTAATATSFIKKYRGLDATKINVITNDFLPRLSHGLYASRITLDQWGNVYAASYFPDSNYNSKYSIAITKGVNTYPNTQPDSGIPLTLVNRIPIEYSSLSGFSVGYGPMDQADVKFQISNNGIDWYFWSGSGWEKTDGYVSNTESDINANISKFSDELGPGQFYFKAFLLTDGTKEVDLKNVTIQAVSISVLPQTGKNDDFNLRLLNLAIMFLPITIFFAVLEKRISTR